MQRDYYVGLDIGTDSIGWAVTDTNYRLLKFKGNAQWGIRLLEESNTAEERRAFRSARRRTMRNRFRTECLQLLFSKEISKSDPSFFARINDSDLWAEDKSVEGKYSLFNDKNFNDKDYFIKYPTIYHLRKAFLDGEKISDVRLLYLAISHIIKNRGHFLFDSASLGDNAIPNFSDVWIELTNYLSDTYSVELVCKNIDDVKDVLKDRKINVTSRKTRLSEIFNIGKADEPAASIIGLLSGASVKSSAIFQNKEYDGTEVEKIDFKSNYDEKSVLYESAFGESFYLIELLKSVYDWALLADVLNDEKYLSYAKVDIYDKHRADLTILKEYVKKYAPDKKDAIFKKNQSGTCNYVAYSGHLSKGSVEKKCSQSDFLDFLKKQLPAEPAEEKYQKMYSEIVLKTFMPKSVTKDNSVIPMQINKAELTRILDNAGEAFPFLNKIDESGKTVKQEIIDIFLFKIPYYVGPLNTHSDKSWLVRNKDKIYPWNFDRVVDVDKSAEKFIENLTNKCTYLVTKDVLPKNSLLYSKFTVLNELNNLKINGHEIPVGLKQSIYNDLFLNHNKVTNKGLLKYLKSKGYEDAEISGIDGDFKSNLKSFREMSQYNISTDDKEKIIKYITIFGDDKKMLRRKLTELFKDKLKKEEIDSVVKLKFAGWGRLSRELLSELSAVSKVTGEVSTIIDFMWTTNNNLMQLLSNDFGFTKAIADANGPAEFTSLKNEVEALYVSPKVKRPIYQSMQILEELVKINGCEPKRIFVEVARGEEKEKTRKVSRKSRLLELYNNCKKEYPGLYTKLKNTDDNDLRRDALYLYYTQFGKCMYTGKTIDISELDNKNLYDIDHIYPRSKLKDDSLNNRVLVTKQSNEEKGNVYPLSRDVQSKMHGFWRMLLDKGLIGDEKYERLTRTFPLTDDELSAFINRQIVETRQSTKAIAQLLEKRYSSEIVYVKANLVSEFRKKYDFVKSRVVNDLHHAKDAYLNIVVGNVYNTRYNHNRLFFIRGIQEGKLSANRIFDYAVEDAWSVEDGNRSIDTVKSMMAKNNIRFTRYSFMQKGGLFKQTIQKKGSGQVPLKKNLPKSDIQKYGGYDKATSTFFALTSYKDEKGKPVRAFVPVNLYSVTDYNKEPENYLKSVLLTMGAKATELSVIIPCVKYNQLFSLDGFRMHISGKSNGGKVLCCKPAMQLVLDPDSEKYIKKVTEYMKKCEELKIEKPVTEYDGLSAAENVKLYSKLIEKTSGTVLKVKFSNIANLLCDGKQKFEALSVYKQCYVLLEILKILHCNATLGNTEDIGGSGKSGAVTISNKLPSADKAKSFKLINQSITGLFEKETELI